jgi:hypothetical protein
MGIRKERVRRLCLRHKQTVAMSAQEGYSSLQEADGAASSCPESEIDEATKPPRQQGSFWRGLSPRKRVWKREERRCEGHAKVKNTWHLRTSRPSSQPFAVVVWDASERTDELIREVSTSQRISFVASVSRGQQIGALFVARTKKLAADQSESTAHGRNRGGQSNIETSGNTSAPLVGRTRV